MFGSARPAKEEKSSAKEESRGIDPIALIALVVTLVLGVTQMQSTVSYGWA